MFPGKDFIDKQILAVLPSEREKTDQKSPPVAIVKQHDLSTIAVFTKETVQNLDMKIHFEAMDDQRSTIKHMIAAQVAEQRLLKGFSVSTMMVVIKAEGALYFDPGLNVVPQKCLPAKGIVKYIFNRSTFILVTNDSTRQQHFWKNK